MGITPPKGLGAAGDVYMIPVGLAHGYRQCNDLALTNILFRPAGLQFPESLTCLSAYRALIDLEPRQRAYHNFQGHLHISDEYFSDVVQQARDIEREYQQQALAWQASGAGLIRLPLRCAGSMSKLADKLYVILETGTSPDVYRRQLPL